MEKKALIEAGRIVNTHGVQGEVKIEVWLDSPQFFKYILQSAVRCVNTSEEARCAGL